MSTVNLFSVDYLELSKPLFLYAILIIGITYHGFKYKKVLSCDFWMCMVLCFFWLLDLILSFLIIKNYIHVKSLFFDTTIYFFFIENIVFFLLIIEVMLYYQWHIAEKFRNDWSPKKQYYAKIISQILAIIMILIHFIMYIDVYFQLNY